MPFPSSPVAIFWFRRDLRLSDNTGFHQALQSGFPVLPLFIFDTNILDKLDEKNDARVEFIHKSLSKIRDNLAEHGSSLLIKHGIPSEIFGELVHEMNIAAVFTNHDYEPYARQRDAEVAELLHENGIPFHSFKDQVVFEKSEVLTAQEKPYTVFTPYSKTWKKQLGSAEIAPRQSENLLNRCLKTEPLPFPTLSDIGFYESGVDFPGKEMRDNIINNYHETRDFPAQNGTSRLSVHLRFGTVSPRALVRKALAANETWLDELIWREFFMQILWHFPKVVDQPFKEKYAAIQWRNDVAEFEKWCNGKTGYPLVDAGMRELNQTGFMHNRVRMLVASFLTKHLLIHWLWGERYFAKKLLDYDLSANNGNWQWAAGCGCDAAPYFRIFNPTTQIEKFDPDWEYIKKWVPEVNSPDYPKPIVEHKIARERCLSTFKSALDS